jgi:hypothetical protein
MDKGTTKKRQKIYEKLSQGGDAKQFSLRGNRLSPLPEA